MPAAFRSLPHLIALAAALLLVSATVSLAAEPTTPASHHTATPVAKPKILVVPDVRDQVFVFAKGMLEDGGFGWQVKGSVPGFAANMVVSQSPSPGTRVIDTGAPKITLELDHPRGAEENGTPENISSYGASLIRLTPAELKAKARAAKASAAQLRATKKQQNSASR
jgi:hypothetical protein